MNCQVVFQDKMSAARNLKTGRGASSEKMAVEVEGLNIHDFVKTFSFPTKVRALPDSSDDAPSTVLAEFSKKFSQEAWEIKGPVLPPELTKNKMADPAGMLAPANDAIREKFVSSNNEVTAAIVDLFVVEKTVFIKPDVEKLLAFMIGKFNGCCGICRCF